jgi:hypothetical protein
MIISEIAAPGLFVCLDSNLFYGGVATMSMARCRRGPGRGG